MAIHDDDTERLRRIETVMQHLNAEVAALREERRVTSENMSADAKDKARRSRAALTASVEAKQRAKQLAARHTSRIARRSAK